MVLVWKTYRCFFLLVGIAVGASSAMMTPPAAFASDCCTIEELYLDQIDEFQILLDRNLTPSSPNYGAVGDCTARASAPLSEVSETTNYASIALSLTSEDLLQPVVNVGLSKYRSFKRRVALEFGGKVLFSEKIRIQKSQEAYFSDPKKLMELRSAFRTYPTFAILMSKTKQRAEFKSPNYLAIVSSLKRCNEIKAKSQEGA